MPKGKSRCARLCEWVLVGACRFITGVSAQWRCSPAAACPRIYFANHSSHLDGLVIWAGLPREVRERTYLVAARDYWEKGVVRRYLAREVFNVVLVDRKPGEGFKRDLLGPLEEKLGQGYSLIIFPEGTRGDGEHIASFKSGLYHLALHVGDAELIPVYLQNLNRVMPKGSALMVPIICSAIFGEALCRSSLDGGKERFLREARQSLINLSLCQSSTIN